MIKPDRQTIMQVFGCLMNKPQYLSDTDKYILNVDDFESLSDRYIFLAIYNLYESGAERIHAIDIDNYFTTDAAATEVVLKNGDGIQFLNECEAYCEPNNFPYYYNKLKKFNLLRDLSSQGYDISEFYTDNMLTPDSFEINARFEKLTTDEILRRVKGKIAEIEKFYLTNAVLQEGKASENIRELIKELKEMPEIGCQLQGDYFNTIVRGGRKGKLYLRSASSGTGKAIPDYVFLPTPNGMRRVGEIRVGDELFDRHGKPTKVTDVFPQGLKNVWTVEFASGKVAECCEEHLWRCVDEYGRDCVIPARVLLKEMEKHRFKVPTNEALHFKHANLPSDPYLVGFRTGEEKSLFCTIPSTYFCGDFEQREALLMGLLDSQETIDENGKISYVVEDEVVFEMIKTICNGLGFALKRDEKTFSLQIFEKKEPFDEIVSITPSSSQTSMTCFTVDNAEHLFLMNDCIVTHNTRTMVGDACNIAYPIRWENGTWVDSGHEPQKVLYVATEQDVDEIQTMILSYLTGINEEKFLYGTFDDDDMPRIEKAIEIMETYQDYMLTARIPNPCSSIVKNLFRRYNLQHGVENFFYDYIFSSPAMLNEYRDLGIREDVALRLFTTTLKNLATELNAFVLTSTQISNDNSEEGGFRDYKYIRGSRAIVDLVDVACIMSRPSINELDALAQREGTKLKLPNVVIDVFKNRRGRWSQVRIWGQNDLGCCRRRDLFLTDANLNPINNFSVVDFKEEQRSELPEFSQDNVISLEDLSTQETVEEAFGATKQRMKNVSFADLI